MRKTTREDLKKMQAWSLQRKIQVTQLRIMEWYEHYNGQVYVSFSGGKDSTVLLDLARRVYPDIEAVFVDTGLEYPEIRKFVKQHDNVTILRPKMRFDEVIKKYGYPVISKEISERIYYAQQGKQWAIDEMHGINHYKCSNQNYKEQYVKYEYLINAPFKISFVCCSEMKKKPFKAFEKRTGKKAILGIMAEESQIRQTQWLRHGCNAFDEKRPKSSPMSFWTEQDVLTYIQMMQEKWDVEINLSNICVKNKCDRQIRKRARKWVAKEKRRLSICSVYGGIVADNEGQTELFETTKHYHCTGCQRTGCMFCMFGVHLEQEPNRFQRMKVTHPKQYDYCINQLGLGKVLDYINVKY